MAGRWTESERAVISHCVAPSFGVCVISPEHIFHPRALFSNQWPPLPESRDTPLQDFISVSGHNWVVSSLVKNNVGQDMAAQFLFKALSTMSELPIPAADSRAFRKIIKYSISLHRLVVHVCSSANYTIQSNIHTFLLEQIWKHLLTL